MQAVCVWNAANSTAPWVEPGDELFFRNRGGSARVLRVENGPEVGPTTVLHLDNGFAWTIEEAEMRPGYWIGEVRRTYRCQEAR